MPACSWWADLDPWGNVAPKPQPYHLEILQKWIEEETTEYEPGMAVCPDKAVWSLCKLLLVVRRSFTHEDMQPGMTCHCLPEYAFAPKGCRCRRVEFALLEPCPVCSQCTRCNGQPGGTVHESVSSSVQTW